MWISFDGRLEDIESRKREMPNDAKLRTNYVWMYVNKLIELQEPMPKAFFLSVLLLYLCVCFDKFSFTEKLTGAKAGFQLELYSFCGF